MIALSIILAQPLAPDNIWFALLLVAALASIHHLSGLRGHMAGHPHTQLHLREIGHRLHERIARKRP